SREIAAEHQRHVPMTSAQTQHQQAASTSRTLLASVNHGRPDVAASVRPSRFNSHGAVESGRPVSPNRAQQDPRGINPSVNPPTNTGRTNPDRPPSLRTPTTATVNPALEQKHQQEQDRLRQQQAQQRQRIEQKHQQEQQKLQQRATDDRKRQDAK